MIVRMARLDRANLPAGKAFVPTGEFLCRSADFGYVAEEWVAEGIDHDGLAYRTQVFIRRPRDPARFSGTVIAEPLHASAIGAVYMYCAPYIVREGHGWACIASQKSAMEEHVKGGDPVRYAALEIGSTFDQPGFSSTLAGGSQAEDIKGFMTALAGFNSASSAILAQVGAALRAPSGPFGKVGNMFLVGHSQTGWVSTEYIAKAHAACRREGGAPIYDGFLPTGMPRAPFGPRDVPLIQVMSDGDVQDAGERLLDPANPGRHYRRPDSDEANDRFRLYELAGVPHLGTRHPPHNSTALSAPRQNGLVKLTDTMNSLPHNELFNMALDHLVKWAGSGLVPPPADRIETTGDGRYFRHDEHGNSRGGVRCVQLDVPRATYRAVPVDDSGVPHWATVGTEIAFDADRMRALYGTPQAYRERFNRRLDELIAERWFLAEDAAGMREEAAAQVF
jgi:hypothetical protein